jgi:hypothetical protein
MKNRPSISLIIACLLLPIVAFAGFSVGLMWSSASRKAIAEDHARWIARYWSKDANLDSLCADINREIMIKILKEEWESGNGSEVVRGPIIDGMRIYILEDKSMHWRTAN